jgi:hypothetical protein
VWRLGRAARGEVTASPDLSGFPGPGGWHYSLLLVGDAPYLLAIATGVQVKMMHFLLAPLDPDDLSLGPAGPALRFIDLCMPQWERPCSIYAMDPTLAEVDELATTEAGALPGAAVLLGVRFDSPSPISSGFIQLQVDDRGAGVPPGVIARMLGLTSAESPRLRGRISSDGEFLVTSITSQLSDAPAPGSWYHIAFSLADPTSLSQLGLSPTNNGPILQFGRDVVITNLDEGRWQIDLIKRGVSVIADLVLPSYTEVWSAGHAQWFARPPGGTAMRLGARCAPSDE